MSEEKKLCILCGKRPRIDPDYEDCWLCRECADERDFEREVEKNSKDADAAVEALHRLCSQAGHEALTRRLNREHRTNQQLACRSIVAMLEKWKRDGDNGAGWYDARNEASVKFATKALAATERERYFPYI
jgi:hypothetical protein